MGRGELPPFVFLFGQSKSTAHAAAERRGLRGRRGGRRSSVPLVAADAEERFCSVGMAVHGQAQRHFIPCDLGSASHRAAFEMKSN